MPNENFLFGMKDLCEELDKRIEKLEKFRDRLQEKVTHKINVDKNSDSLSRVNNSLRYAKDARRAMESSCCDYGCQFQLQDKQEE